MLARYFFKNQSLDRSIARGLQLRSGWRCLLIALRQRPARLSGTNRLWRSLLGMVWVVADWRVCRDKRRTPIGAADDLRQPHASMRMSLQGQGLPCRRRVGDGRSPFHCGRSRAAKSDFPLNPNFRTNPSGASADGSCHLRTHAPQQKSCGNRTAALLWLPTSGIILSIMTILAPDARRKPHDAARPDPAPATSLLRGSASGESIASGPRVA